MAVMRSNQPEHQFGVVNGREAGMQKSETNRQRLVPPIIWQTRTLPRAAGQTPLSRFGEHLRRVGSIRIAASVISLVAPVGLPGVMEIGDVFGVVDHRLQKLGAAHESLDEISHSGAMVDQSDLGSVGPSAEVIAFGCGRSREIV